MRSSSEGSSSGAATSALSACAADQPPAAIEHEPYRALAEHLWQTRESRRREYTPAAEAARAIADAIVDDGGPLRYGCDPLGRTLLAGWRATASDEEWLRPFLQDLTG